MCAARAVRLQFDGTRELPHNRAFYVDHKHITKHFIMNDQCVPFSKAAPSSCSRTPYRVSYGALNRSLPAV